jgi:hypothetical protein
MQVSATLIAAQAAAREARTRLALPQATQQPGFAAALEKTEGFSPLPLRQAAAPAPAAATQTTQASKPVRMGQHLDITV